MATIIASIYFHEIGHYFAAKELGGKASIQWGGLFTVVEDVPMKDLSKVYHTGILAGLIPILVWILSSWVGFFTGSVILMYYLFVGCNEDFKAIKKLRRWNQ